MDWFVTPQVSPRSIITFAEDFRNVDGCPCVLMTVAQITQDKRIHAAVPHSHISSAAHNHSYLFDQSLLGGARGISREAFVLADRSLTRVGDRSTSHLSSATLLKKM